MKAPQIMLWGYFLFMAAPVLRVTADHTLRVMCDDVTTIYFDGKEQSDVAGTNVWNGLATKTIPANVKSVTIGCLNKGGANGIKAEITDSSGKIVSQTGKSWKCSNNKDSSYMPATVEVNNLAWRDKLGNAAIIWSSSAKDNTAYCKFEMADSAACSSSSKGHTLKLMCDDYSTIYYDGVEQKNVAGTGAWNQLAVSEIPAATKEVLVKCYNWFGGNGIKAQIVNNKGKVINQTGKSWLCSTDANFSFKPAFIEAPKGEWRNQLGNAATIWSGTGHDGTAYCKFTLPGCSHPAPAPPAAGKWEELRGYLLGYSAGVNKYSSLGEAQSECLKRSDCGGITYEPSSRMYTLRKGGELKPSPRQVQEKTWMFKWFKKGSSGSGCGSNTFTMKMMCDDYSTIYYDGVEQKGVAGTRGWNSMATSTFPASTKEVMVKCQNVGGAYGIKAQIFNNKGKAIRQTNKFWQCSNQQNSGFKRATVTQSHADNWKDMLGSAVNIWSSGPVVNTAYCKVSLPGCAEEEM